MNTVQQIGQAVGAPLDLGARGLVAATNIGINGYKAVSARTVKFTKGSAYGLHFAGTRQDYATMNGDTARYNSAVEAVVGWICRNFPEAPVRIAESPTKEGEPVKLILPSEAGPGAMLRLMERPNEWYSGVLLWMATLADWCWTGNGYWIKVRAPGGRVKELWWAPSDMMEPRWDMTRSDQFIGWYEYTVDGVTYAYGPENVVHFRDGLDPRNMRKGFSKLASLLREVYTDDEAANMTASLMRNLGVPGVIIAPANTTGPTGRIQDPEQVKETFMQKFGGDKRGEPMVLTIPTEVKVLSWSPQQMDMRSLRKVPEERISAVYGVAAIVAGLGAGLDRSTFANFGEARKAAYEEAIIPGQRLFAAELEVQLLPDFGGNADVLDVFFDWKMASAMREAASEVWKRYQDAAVKGLLKRSSFKRAVGEPIGEEDDVYIMPSNFLLLKPSEKPPLQTAPQLGAGKPPFGKDEDGPAKPKQIPAEAGRNGSKPTEAMHT